MAIEAKNLKFEKCQLDCTRERVKFKMSIDIVKGERDSMSEDTARDCVKVPTFDGRDKSWPFYKKKMESHLARMDLSELLSVNSPAIPKDDAADANAKEQEKTCMRQTQDEGIMSQEQVSMRSANVSARVQDKGQIPAHGQGKRQADDGTKGTIWCCVGCNHELHESSPARHDRFIDVGAMRCHDALHHSHVGRDPHHFVG